SLVQKTARRSPAGRKGGRRSSSARLLFAVGRSRSRLIVVLAIQRFVNFRRAALGPFTHVVADFLAVDVHGNAAVTVRRRRALEFVPVEVPAEASYCQSGGSQESQEVAHEPNLLRSR